MSYKVKTISHFERQAKRLIKKFPSLKNELVHLGQELKVHPQQGTSLGYDCYKIRLSIASKGKGKSGGARVITHIAITETTVYLLSIFDKSEQATITDKELKALLKQIG
jgi:hypothetical protein